MPRNLISRRNSQNIVLMLSFIKKLHESIIIWAGHLNINIIISRNEPLVSHCSNQCSICKKISDIIFLAEISYLYQNSQCMLLMFLN